MQNMLDKFNKRKQQTNFLDTSIFFDAAGKRRWKFLSIITKDLRLLRSAANCAQHGVLNATCETPSLIFSLPAMALLSTHRLLPLAFLAIFNLKYQRGHVGDATHAALCISMDRWRSAGECRAVGRDSGIAGGNPPLLNIAPLGTKYCSRSHNRWSTHVTAPPSSQPRPPLIKKSPPPCTPSITTTTTLTGLRLNRQHVPAAVLHRAAHGSLQGSTFLLFFLHASMHSPVNPALRTWLYKKTVTRTHRHTHTFTRGLTVLSCIWNVHLESPQRFLSSSQQLLQLLLWRLSAVI